MRKIVKVVLIIITVIGMLAYSFPSGVSAEFCEIPGNKPVPEVCP